MVMSVLDDRIGNFKTAIKDSAPLRVVRRHIIHGDCYILSDEQYFNLKSEIADHFEIHTNEVVVVGSAKLGFSIARDKRYRPFGDGSDIDVALVSQVLFDKVWEAAYEFWKDRGYWVNQSDFKKYLFRGWIRPDKLPVSGRFPICSEWWEFFRTLTSSNRYGLYNIRGALYKSWYYLEHYQAEGVNACKEETER